MLGITQLEFAEILNMSYQQTQKVEKGVNRISAGQLYEIACALNTPITYFYEGLGEELRPLTPHERRLLNFTRCLADIQNEVHRVALSELVRALAGR